MLTAPGKDIFLVHPDLKSQNTIKLTEKKITLTPHGCGVKLRNSGDVIKYLSEGILIGDKYFKKGESINIGSDVLVRTSNMNSDELNEYVKIILGICPGTVYGKLHQMFSRTKYGDFDYSSRNI